MSKHTEELYDACAVGDLLEVKKALANKPDVNAQTHASGFTPLHVCVSGNHRHEERQEIIRLLCRAGAKLEQKDEEKGLTPLHYTSLRNKPLLAEVLLQCGADIHAIEGNGATPLHGAAFHGNIEVAKVLLDHGADPNRADHHGYTPKSLAQDNKHEELVTLFTTHKKTWWKFWK